MMTIRRGMYESDNNYQDVFTRIRLDVERVATLVNPLVGSLTVNTDKPWVGKINSSDGTFNIVQTNSSILPLRLFAGNFFTIFISGKVVAHKHKTTIDVKFKLGWYTALAFFLIVSFPTTWIVNQGEWNNVSGLILLFLMFDVLPPLVLIVQLNRVENSILELLGAT